MVGLTCNPRTTDTQAAGRSQVVGRPELHREILPQQITAKQTERRGPDVRDKSGDDVDQRKDNCDVKHPCYSSPWEDKA